MSAAAIHKQQASLLSTLTKVRMTLKEGNRNDKVGVFQGVIVYY